GRTGGCGRRPRRSRLSPGWTASWPISRSSQMSRADLAVFGGPRAVTADPGDPWPSFDQDTIDEVSRQIRGGQVAFDMDEAPVRQLEQTARQFFGAEHVLAVSSGTAALHAALFALGLTRGMSVICPAYTFFRTATP